jgi:hypothetical protein
VERYDLGPSSDSPCPCRAATLTAPSEPGWSCHRFRHGPPIASKQSVYQCAFSMAATASDPIRSDLRPKVLLQHSRLIMRADYRMFKKLRLWHDTNTLRRESMTGCNTNANRYERSFLFRTFYTINRKSWSSGLTFLLRIRDVRVQISAWRSAILTDVGRFPQSLQANAGIVP